MTRFTRFNIRDLIWLTTLVATLAAWWTVEQSRVAELTVENENLRKRLAKIEGSYMEEQGKYMEQYTILAKMTAEYQERRRLAERMRAKSQEQGFPKD